MPKDYSKYNHGHMIKLDDIPKDEISQALNDFSEGSEGLRKCLSVMWKNNLKTIACCAGNENSFEEAYILMDENVDMFSYISNDLLLSDMVKISCDENNRQEIRFIGPSLYKEQHFSALANDIISGKKSNLQSLKNKIGKPFPQEWKVNGTIYNMMKGLISTAGPIKRMRIISLCRALNNSTLEQQKNIIQKCYRELALSQQEQESRKQR